MKRKGTLNEQLDFWKGQKRSISMLPICLDCFFYEVSKGGEIPACKDLTFNHRRGSFLTGWSNWSSSVTNWANKSIGPPSCL